VAAADTRFEPLAAERSVGAHLPALDAARRLFVGRASRADLAALPCSDSVPLPGPHWRVTTFCRVLTSAGLVGGGRLARPDVDLIFIAQCGRGGAMSVVDFCEALAEIGRRLYPADESPVGRLARLLAEHFAEPTAAVVATPGSLGVSADESVAREAEQRMMEFEEAGAGQDYDYSDEDP